MTNSKLVQIALLVASAVYKTAAAPSLPTAGDPGSSDKGCQIYVGPQGQGTSMLTKVFQSSFTDDLNDGNRVNYDDEHNAISIVTGKDSLPESLVTVSIKAPGAVTDDGPYVYRLLQNDYCSVHLKKIPAPGSVITVFKGPVPPIPRVHGGECTSYAGMRDPEALDMTSLNATAWTDGNKNGKGTVVSFDEKTKQIKIVTGTESKDTSLVMFNVNTVYIANPNSGSSSTWGTGFRIRSGDSCSAIIPEDSEKGISRTYSVTVGTPLLY